MTETGPRGSCKHGLRGTRAVLVVAVGVCAIAACGSTSSSSSSAPPAATAAQAAAASPPKGAPIKVLVISFVDTPLASEPGPFAGAKAAARAINAAGGINGHPLQIITCNSQFLPAVELACAGRAVTDRVTAVAGSLAFANSPANLAVWQANDIADVGSLPTVPQDFTNPINFPLESFLQSVACTTLFPKIAGVTRLGVPVENLAIALAGYKLDQLAAARAHTGLVEALVQPTATDQTSYVDELAQAGANGIFLAIDEAQSPQFIQSAASLGKAWPYCHSDGVMTGAQLEQLGPAVRNFYVGAVVPPPTATAQYPELKTFLSQMAAEYAAGDAAASTSATKYGWEMLQAWLAIQAVEQVARHITGPITHNTFLAQIRHSTVSFGGIIPTINFAKPNPDPEFARIFNPYVTLMRWDPVKKNFYLIPGVKPFDALAALSR